MKIIKSSEMEARGSKNLLSGEPMRQQSWPSWILMKSLRILVLTILWTGVGMGAGLFAGIVVMMFSIVFVHHRPDLTQAYRHGAFPAAIGAGAVAFVWNVLRTMQAAAARAKAAKATSKAG
jgi:nitric oxide reductase large subunit